MTLLNNFHENCQPLSTNKLILLTLLNSVMTNNTNTFPQTLSHEFLSHEIHSWEAQYLLQI